MTTYEHTVEIERPIDEVFFVTEPRNYPRWQPSLVQVRPCSDGALRVGSRVTEVRRFLGREMETTWTCTEHEPSTRSTIEDPDGPVPFRGTFTLKPVARGTRFTWTVETGGVAGSRLAGPLVGRMTRRELERNTARLKEIMEGRDS
jgi:Polyketide cyclase / dehydrase and lipid transport